MSPAPRACHGARGPLEQSFQFWSAVWGCWGGMTREEKHLGTKLEMFQSCVISQLKWRETSPFPIHTDVANLGNPVASLQAARSVGLVPSNFIATHLWGTARGSKENPVSCTFWYLGFFPYFLLFFTFYLPKVFHHPSKGECPVWSGAGRSSNPTMTAHLLPHLQALAVPSGNAFALKRSSRVRKNCKKYWTFKIGITLN